MSANDTDIIQGEKSQKPFSLGDLALLLFAVFAGSLFALTIFPDSLKGIEQSLSDINGKAFWYLSRSSAVIAYLLLWISMILGVGITNKLAAIWPGLPSTIELHKFISLLGIAFAIFHALILLGDNYMNLKVQQILIPFSFSGYKPIAVGIGQVVFYLWVIIAVSFYIRNIIGRKAWRVIHFLSFVVFCAVLIHGIIAGTESSLTTMQIIYWVTTFILLYMVVYRILISKQQKIDKKDKIANRSTIISS